MPRLSRLDAPGVLHHVMGRGIERGRRPELVGGGLIRSMGGWWAVLASRRRGEREVADQRILGDGDFVKHGIWGTSINK